MSLVSTGEISHGLHNLSRREFTTLVLSLSTSALLLAKIGLTLPIITIPLALGAGGYMKGIIRGDEDPLKEAIRWATLGLSATVIASMLASCAPLPSEQGINNNQIVKPDVTKTIVPQPSPTKDAALRDYQQKEVKISPEAAFFSVTSRLMTSERSIGLDTLVSDPVQRDSIARALLENSIVANKGYAAIQREVLQNGTAIGFSGCADSRHTAPFLFPTTQKGVQIEKYLQASVGATLQTSAIGTQPAVFDKGVNMSFFVTHSKCAGATEGCGALGGIKVIMEGGESELIHHGVSTGTIAQLKSLIAMGADYEPEKWAETGARLQAELNFKAHGVNHFVAYGISGVADGSFTATNVIDSFGNKYPIDQFKLLKEYADYFHNPHPILERIALGQTPKINLLNGSKKYSSSVLFGEMAQDKGVIFKVSSLDTMKKTLTVGEVREMIRGIDYSLTHLKQDGKVLMLVADDVQSMTVLRTTLLAEAKGIQNFIADGGVIVEVFPDLEGRFAGFLTVRNKLTLAQELNILKGVFSKAVIDQDLLKEAQEIVSKQMKAKIISEGTGNKITGILGKLKPVGRLMNYAVGRIGDAQIILDVVNFIQKDLLGLDTVWNVPAANIQLDPRFEMPPIEDDLKFMQANPQVNPRLQNFEITITQDQLRLAYKGAFLAYMKWGKYGAEPSSPWNQMNPEDVGKLIQITIPEVTFTKGSTRSTFGSPAEKHTFFTLIQPETDLSTGKIVYDSEDPNQKMMLNNIQSGIPIFGSVPTENSPRVIVSLSPNNPNLIYFWQVDSVPDKKVFKIRFIFAKNKNK